MHDTYNILNLFTLNAQTCKWDFMIYFKLFHKDYKISVVHDISSSFSIAMSHQV